MKAHPIGVYQGSLFGRQSYLNDLTGELDCLIFGFNGVDMTQFTKLPNFSMARVRQLFIQSKEIPPDVLGKYHLERTDVFQLCAQNNPEEYDYIRYAHIYCEDHQIEEEFWDFYDQYTIPITIKWCEENGYPYTEE